MLTAARIIQIANQNAHTPGYTDQGLINLNGVLSGLCQHHALSLARGNYQFNFNPALSTMFGSGPYVLPLDYLRTSDTSGATGASRSVWFLYPTPALPSGQPVYMTPIDLAEFDGYPQFPSQSLPELWATDMGGTTTQRIVLSTTAAIIEDVATIIPAIDTNIRVGLSVAGEGIVPGSTIEAITTELVTAGDTNSSTTLTNVVSVAGVVVGQGISGSGIPAGTVVTDLPGGGVVEMSQAATVTDVGQAITFDEGGLTLSSAPTLTLSAASVFFGIAPVAYVYPPPLGSYPVTVRYQRQMPDIFDTAQIPWFPDEQYLIDELSARQMELSDDTRQVQFEAAAQRRLQKYLGLEGDKINRAQSIQLDPRNFAGGYGGLAYARARNTKVAGW